jgi:Tol biopolymer transport system component
LVSEAKGVGVFGVGFASANLLKMSLVTSAAMLAICVLALVETTNTAEAEDSPPQNGKIVFARSTPSGERRYIYTVNSDGSGLSRLTKGTPPFPTLPAWSPDGTQIAFFDVQIWVMRADGSNLRKLTPNKLDAPGRRPSWLPDGKRLAYGHKVSAYAFPDIYTMDLYGSNITKITNTPNLWEEDVDFSPDGSQVCLYRYPESRQRVGIYVMNVDASNPTRLTDDRATGCAWSPDGTKIAYSYTSDDSDQRGYEANTEVYVMNADGSGKTNLTNNRANDEEPQWSPDGTKITFMSDRNGDYEIYTMDADGSDVALVTKSPGAGAFDPDWQPLHKPTPPKVHQPPTGGPSLLLVASALLFCGGVLFYAGVKRRM